MADPDVEWEQRRLCPDGACIGVIGADGRCKVCGMPAPEAGGPFRAGPVSDAALDDESDDEDEAAEGLDAAGALDDDDDRRELCPDDACIGLIGPDGHCKECGKPRDAAATTTT